MKNNFYTLGEDLFLPPHLERDEGEENGEWEYPTHIFAGSILMELPDPMGGEGGVKCQVLYHNYPEEYHFSECAETIRGGEYIQRNMLTKIEDPSKIMSLTKLATMLNGSVDNLYNMLKL